jgi:hypothetical protein
MPLMIKIAKPIMNLALNHLSESGNESNYRAHLISLTRAYLVPLVDSEELLVECEFKKNISASEFSDSY